MAKKLKVSLAYQADRLYWTMKREWYGKLAAPMAFGAMELAPKRKSSSGSSS
jgi:hypothetical protein